MMYQSQEEYERAKWMEEYAEKERQERLERGPSKFEIEAAKKESREANMMILAVIGCFAILGWLVFNVFNPIGEWLQRLPEENPVLMWIIIIISIALFIWSLYNTPKPNKNNEHPKS